MTKYKPVEIIQVTRDGFDMELGKELSPQVRFRCGGVEGTMQVTEEQFVRILTIFSEGNTEQNEEEVVPPPPDPSQTVEVSNSVGQKRDGLYVIQRPVETRKGHTFTPALEEEEEAEPGEEYQDKETGVPSF